MTMRAEIERLTSEHSRLLALAASLGRHLNGSFPTDRAALDDFHGARTQLRNQLIAHLKREDWVLYPSMLASDDRQLAITAQNFADEMGHISEAFSNYSRQWLPDAIAADWPGYCAATKGILGALAERIEREDGELYPLASTVEAVDAAVLGMAQVTVSFGASAA
ncbi:hemerythrin domain-containing protein [Sphingopyxis witflariensis]|nr:hemerythrin domain-containing protein [Sphingopyxis witflariensis]